MTMIKLWSSNFWFCRPFFAVDRAVWEITASYLLGLLVGSYWSVLTQNPCKTNQYAALKNRQSCRVQKYPFVTTGLTKIFGIFLKVLLTGKLTHQGALILCQALIFKVIFYFFSIFQKMKFHFFFKFSIILL